jgi:hypothetical protein
VADKEATISSVLKHVDSIRYQARPRAQRQ